jgi:deoxyadenosine/deoxycytidine kinase
MPRRSATPRSATVRKKQPAFKLPEYIAVEGPIRVGKSSLARILAERMHARRILDCDEENPFLADFYSEKDGASFATQMYFLNERYQRLHEAFAAEQTGSVVADFLFEKDRIFANLTLGNEELKLYDSFFARFAQAVPVPELVIYLQATPDVLEERLTKKAARNESHISREYIEEVVHAYEHFFFHYTASNLLVVNTSEIDFVQRNADLQQLLQRLEEPVKGTQYFLPLGNT